MKKNRGQGGTVKCGRREFTCFMLSAIAMPDELWAASRPDACLFADNVVELPPSGCGGDPFDFRHRRAVDAMVNAYGIGNVNLGFVGCSQVAFKTQPDGTGPMHACTIFYPSGYEQSTYIAPLAHELAHVFQLQETGGYDRLVQRFPSLRIELEADFMAGLMFKNFLTDANAEWFHTNLDLIGKFREFNSNEHGTPAQRASSFQRGLNLNYSDFHQNMRAVHAKFQNDIFGEIMYFTR